MAGRSHASGKKTEFRVHQLVLCRYETYPYWPAKISNNFPLEVCTAHCCQLQTLLGTYTFYWCMFCGEDKGGWVRQDRLVHFHPDLVRYTRVPKHNEWYSEQQKALKTALKIYNSLHSEALPPIAPSPTPDLLNARKCRNIFPFSDVQCEEEPEEENADAFRGNSGTPSPTVETEAESTDPAREDQRENKPTAKRPRLELQDANGSAKETSQPKRTRHSSDTGSAGPDATGSDVGVTFYAPTLSEDPPLVLLEKSRYYSRPITSESFTCMMGELRQTIEAYNDAARDAKEEHRLIEEQKDSMRIKYKTMFQKLQEMERGASNHQKTLIVLLRDILEARVDITDLKAHKAGAVVKGLARTCANVPSIHNLCDEIVKVWSDVVEEYFQNV